MRVKEQLHVVSRAAWRAWLKQNHGRAKEVWLAFHKKHTQKAALPYEDAVEEAICFGWIDSLVKRLDEDTFARKFTPRKAQSKWSETNKARARKMIESGLMHAAGMTAVRASKKSGAWYESAMSPAELKVPPFITKALSENKKALEFFNSLSTSSQRQCVGWISSAKRAETRLRRLAEAIVLFEKGEKLGMR